MVRFYSSCNGAYSLPESAVPGRSCNCISPWLHRDYRSMPYWYNTSKNLDLSPQRSLPRTRYRYSILVWSAMYRYSTSGPLGSSLLSKSLTPAYATVLLVCNRMVFVSETGSSLIHRPVLSGQRLRTGPRKVSSLAHPDAAVVEVQSVQDMRDAHSQLASLRSRSLLARRSVCHRSPSPT